MSLMKSIRNALVVTIATFAPFTLADQTVPDSYRGVPFGASEARAREIIKFESCEATPAYFGLLAKLATRMCVSSFLVGTVKVQDFFHFRKDALVTVHMTFRSNDFENLRGVFIEKYGKPTRDQREILQNRFGAKFENETLTWAGPNVTVTLNRFASDLESGSAFFHVNAFTREYDKAQADENRKAKGAF